MARLAKVVMSALFLSLFLAVGVSAQCAEKPSSGCCGDKSEKVQTSEQVKPGDEKVVIFNKFCPVLGGEVDEEVTPVEYNGKYYGFCCPGCDTKFKADPEKYSKNISEDGQKFIGEKPGKMKM